MLIAEKRKNENIAEYLLYMWQVEDIIRANKFDIDLIRKNIIDHFNQPDKIKQKVVEWYENLIEMMIREDIKEQGHLQINKNVIANLDELHAELLKTPEEADYISTYYKTLPFIVELRAKSDNTKISEIETCFSALYGFLLLKIQDKTISGETQAAVAQISSFLRSLAIKYHQL